MLSGTTVFDFETTGLRPELGHHPFILGMEDESGKVAMVKTKDKKNYAKLAAILADPKVAKVGHGVKFDVKMALESGLQVNGPVHDTMLLTYMNNEYEPNLKLKDVAFRQLGMRPDEEEAVKKELRRLTKELGREANYSDLPDHLLLPYLEGDLDRTLKLFWKHGHIITGPQRRVYEIEQEVIRNVVEIERWGIHVDVPYCKKMIEQFAPRLREARDQMFNIAGIKFNPNSPKQLGTIMENLGLDTGAKNKDGSMNTNAIRLKALMHHEFVKCLSEYRSLSKLGTTYFESFIEHQVDGIVHPSFWPFGQDEGIKTGRFSSSDPNFQNIPGGGRGKNEEMLKDPGLIRRAVRPRSPEYVFLLGDYKQIEFVIFGCNAGDEGILNELRAGVDFHTANAYRLYGRDCFKGKSKDEVKRIRFNAKELNFSFIFGMGVSSYAQRNGLTLQVARQNKAKFFNEIPAARDFLLRAQADLLRDGYVQDQFGRRYHVPRDLCYKAANVLCQGPAALVMKRGINRTCAKLKGLDAHPFITVHDELGVEVRRDQVYDAYKAMVEGMEDHDNFPVPIKVDMSIAETSWADKKEWKEVEEKWKPKKKTFVLRR